jgi:hypothetical protein
MVSVVLKCYVESACMCVFLFYLKDIFIRSHVLQCAGYVAWLILRTFCYILTVNFIEYPCVIQRETWSFFNAFIILSYICDYKVFFLNINRVVTYHLVLKCLWFIAVPQLEKRFKFNTSKSLDSLSGISE